MLGCRYKNMKKIQILKDNLLKSLFHPIKTSKKLLEENQTRRKSRCSNHIKK